jgi:AraC family transcriptional regulator
MHMLGIAFDFGGVAARIESEVRADDLVSVASALHEDPLLSAVATALWRDAEAHGSSSLFFDHGLALIVRRFCELRGKPPASAIGGKLNPRQLADVLAAIHDRLGEDVGVAELARVVGQDVRSFTRAFKRTTGYTPFAYLTARRMDRAKALLRTGASMIEVAAAVGYANPSKCAAAFRRWIDCSPTQWLRSQ